MIRVWIVVILSAAALVLAAFVPAASLGYRFGLLELRDAFDLMFRWGGDFEFAGNMYPTRLAAGLGLAALAVIIAITPRPRGVIALAILALAANGASGYTIWQMRANSEKYPRIHDISTDLENIPEFVAVAGLRGAGDHPVAYEAEYDAHCAGEGAVCDPAALQREAFPDIQPVILYVGWGDAYELALDAAQSMGWEIVDGDRAAGRIEATDTTAWFGFKDDIVIRLTSEGASRTRVDIRSKSRVGQSDLGKNAARVRAYLEKLRSRA